MYILANVPWFLLVDYLSLLHSLARARTHTHTHTHTHTLTHSDSHTHKYTLNKRNEDMFLLKPLRIPQDSFSRNYANEKQMVHFEFIFDCFLIRLFSPFALFRPKYESFFAHFSLLLIPFQEILCPNMGKVAYFVANSISFIFFLSFFLYRFIK